MKPDAAARLMNAPSGERWCQKLAVAWGFDAALRRF
jgi:hypothetical protein